MSPQVSRRLLKLNAPRVRCQVDCMAVHYLKQREAELKAMPRIMCLAVRRQIRLSLAEARKGREGELVVCFWERLAARLPFFLAQN
ncbi:hypothetical protein N0V88_000790 [Collariella sp. IMI 366227]|nr:hypothetical protein N0V88_000790 [Collariella sp. IMI 366227]